MDIATLTGLMAGAGLICWAILSKSSADAFIDPQSVAIVIGGAVCASMVSMPLKAFMAVFGVVKKVFFTKAGSVPQIIKDLVGYAEVARRDGILSLESAMANINDPFVVRGVQMVVDGTDPQLIEQIMTSELEAVAERHSAGKSIFDSMGRYAPAFGMIGTLIGLVIMLGKMGGDPAGIGPAMAVALLTTLYGALFANLVALPIADKLGIRSNEELMLKTIVVRGIMSIQSGENPRIVEQKLTTFLPPKLRPTDDDQKRAA